MNTYKTPDYRLDRRKEFEKKFPWAKGLQYYENRSKYWTSSSQQ